MKAGCKDLARRSGCKVLVHPGAIQGAIVAVIFEELMQLAISACEGCRVQALIA